MKAIFINPTFFPEVPNIGLAYIMSSVEKKHDVRLLDLGFRYKNYREYIIDEINEYRPDVVGISVLSPNYSIASEIAEFIKEINPDIMVVFGGVHCTLNPEAVIGNPCVDAVCIGDGEKTAAELLDRLEMGEDLKIDGMWYKDKDKKIIRNRLRPFQDDLDSMAFPNWDHWDIERYSGMGDYYPNSLIHTHSRGCPYDCAFCTNPAISNSNPGKYYRVRRPKNVIDEIRINYEKYGSWFKTIFFNDEIFGLDKENFREFCSAFIDSGLNRKLTWSCQTRADVIDDDWAKRARAAGCGMVCLGIESGDENLRRNILKKDVLDNDIRTAVGNLERYNIPYKFTMILGFPQENRDTAERSLAMSRTFNPIRTDFLYYQLFPHTSLGKQVDSKNRISYGKKSKKKKIVYIWVKKTIELKGLARKELSWIMTRAKASKVLRFLRQGIRLKGLYFLLDILKFILSIDRRRRRPLNHPAIFGELYQTTVSRYIREDLYRCRY